MQLTNTATTFGSVTKVFHWLMALMIFTVIPLGVIAHNLPIEGDSLALKARLYSAHKTLGLAIFFTALVRILWAISQSARPGAFNADKKAETFMAALVHYALYTSLVLVPVMGWMTHAATEGFAPILWPFGQDLFFVPKDPELAERFAHMHKFWERVMVVSILLHVAGALKHHFVDKDATLRRMWFGTTDEDCDPAEHGKTPAIIAAIIFVAVGVTAWLQPVETQAEVAALETVTSDWTVQEGAINITVRQFGSDVQGTFADWTAAISYDPDAEGDLKGDVTTTINIGSLTLGSVTGQAMGPDFFDVEGFPTATFQADLRIDDGLVIADGSLTIKSMTVPVAFPVDLTIDGDTATATARTEVNRLDFGIGTSQPDESSLAFAVAIDINLTATR